MTQPAASIVPRNGFGIAALVLAVIALVFGLVPFTGFIALILGLLAVLFGVLGWSRTRRGLATDRTMTVIGTVLGIGAAALGAWSAGTGSGAPGELPRNAQQVARAPAVVGDVVGDVVVVGCSVRSEAGVPAIQATVRITNKTDRVQTYLATIGVNDASGARIGRVDTVSSPLGEGESVTVSGMDAGGTALNGARPGPATCVVTNVNRLPAARSCLPGEVDAKLC